MNIRSLAQISLFILSFMPLQVNGDPDDFKEEAAKALPHRPSTFKEFIEPFQPILHPRAKIKYKKFGKIMFQDNFPEPKHPDAVILKGFRCLFSKVADAHKNANVEEEAQLQLNALYQLLAFHKGPIAEINPILADEITVFPCENCKKSAKGELGIEIEHEKY